MQKKLSPQNPSLWLLFWQFVKLSLVGWGGPVARIALLHEEFVRRQKWITERHFTKILAVYQILPGPEATELAVFFGFAKRRHLGGILTGLGFMLPGFLFMLLATWLYAHYGVDFTPLQAILYGIKPAVIALIALALWNMTTVSVTHWKLGLIAIGAAFAFFYHISFVIILIGGGILSWLVFSTSSRASLALLVLPPLIVSASFPLVFWVFVKAGLLTFGGAYTLVPFVYQEAVQKYGWLTASQYLDGIALAQLLPAPLSIIATFTGYFAHGFSGAILATAGVFFPAFLFTLFGFDSIERIASHKKFQIILSGVTAAVVGLLFSTFLDLFWTSVVDLFTALLALCALFLLLRKTNIALVILGAGALGYIAHVFF